MPASSAAPTAQRRKDPVVTAWLMGRGTCRARLRIQAAAGPAPWQAARPPPDGYFASIGFTSPQSLETNLPVMSFWMCIVIFGLVMSADVLTVKAVSPSSV